MTAPVRRNCPECGQHIFITKGMKHIVCFNCHAAWNIDWVPKLASSGTYATHSTQSVNIPG